MKDDSGKKRKNDDYLDNLGKIKKPKIEITSSQIINMGKVPSNKDKINIIELDINELSDILNNNKRTLRTRSSCINKKKNETENEAKKSKKWIRTHYLTLKKGTRI